MKRHKRSAAAAIAPAAAVDAVREQLALELRRDLLAGRGKLPRDSSGRIARGFLEARPSTPAHDASASCHCAECLREFPRELEPRGASVGLGSLAELLAQVTAIAPAAAAPASRVVRLEALELELSQLLRRSAPQVWLEIRGPLRRLLNRARRELRAADRASSAKDFPTFS